MQVNGAQLAAVCKDDTVIAWSYPSGEILFQTNEPKELVFEIKWNPFRQDVFATLHKVRMAVNSLFRIIFPHFSYRIAIYSIN